MDAQDRYILAIRSWAGHSALFIAKEYGIESAPDLFLEVADQFLRALAAITSPQEARERLADVLGSLPVAHNSGGIRLVVNNG